MESLALIVPPAEIAADFIIVKAAALAFDNALRSNGYILMNVLEEASTTIGAQEVIDAGIAIADYNLDACGIAPAGGGTIGLFGG